MSVLIYNSKSIREVLQDHSDSLKYPSSLPSSFSLPFLYTALIILPVVAQNPSKVNWVGADTRRVAHGEFSTAELNAILVVVSLADNVLDIRRWDVGNMNAEADQVKFCDVVVESGELREGDSDRLLAMVVQVVDHDVGVGSGSLASGGLGCGSRGKNCDGAGDDG